MQRDEYLLFLDEIAETQPLLDEHEIHAQPTIVNVLQLPYEKPRRPGKELVYCDSGEEVAPGTLVILNGLGAYVDGKPLVTKNHFEKIKNFLFKDAPDASLPSTSKIVRIGDKFYVEGKEVERIPVKKEPQAASTYNISEGIFLFSIEEKDTLYVDQNTGELVPDQSKVAVDARKRTYDGRIVVLLRTFLKNQFQFKDTGKILNSEERKLIFYYDKKLYVEDKIVIKSKRPFYFYSVGSDGKPKSKRSSPHFFKPETSSSSSNYSVYGAVGTASSDKERGDSSERDCLEEDKSERRNSRRV